MIQVKGKNIYLSGPMTGSETFNAALFSEAHVRLRKAGAAFVFDPIEEYYNDETGEQSHETYMRRCVNELTSSNKLLTEKHNRRKALCHDEPFYDMLVQLDGWEDSKGACIECNVAYDCGIPVHEIGEVFDA